MTERLKTQTHLQGSAMELYCAQCNSTLQVSNETLSEHESIRCPSCGSMVYSASEVESISPTIIVKTGRQLAHFELLRLLGRGHYGEVWRAHDSRLGRDVAIKIPRGFSLDAESIQQFVRESRANSQLSHPNIVPIYDVGNENDHIYIVYKLIDGVTLKQYAKSQKPSVRSIVEILKKVCDALQHAHDKCILHRDVKPGNIMIDQKGEPHLTDFGMASHNDSNTEATLSGALKGTVAYMSPEIAAGRIRDADGRSDQYAVGVILYELLTGQRPFEGNVQQLLHQIVNDDPVLPSELVPGVPRELESITLKALEKSPDNRYGSCAELRDDLQRFLDGGEVTVKPSARTKPVGRKRIIQPKRYLLVMVAVSAIFGCLLAGWFWLSNDGVVGDDSLAALPPRIVSINTIPEGASVVLYPIHAVTGHPMADKGIRPNETTPLKVKLTPADYLIVAVPDKNLDEHKNYTFHEVIRRVPSGDAGLPSRFKHQRWLIETDGSVVLPEISLPLSMVVEGMAVFGNDSEAVESPNGVPVNMRTSPFLLDTREVTLEDYKALMDGKSPVFTKKGLPISDDEIVEKEAVRFVSYDEALLYAERAGKRLPTEAEFNFAATSGGTKKFPWGDDDGIMDEWIFGAPGVADFDFTDTDPPVYGLFSNVGEWTMNHPAVIDDSKLDRKTSTNELRVIKGIIPSQLNEAFAKRHGLDRKEFQRGATSVYTTGLRHIGLDRIGFRCARSKSPRLKEADFNK